jgi:hypothetical protein
VGGGCAPVRARAHLRAGASPHGAVPPDRLRARGPPHDRDLARGGRAPPAPPDAAFRARARTTGSPSITECHRLEIFSA